MNLSKKQVGKDFVLVLIGQIISLFGNAALRFALPLHLLSVTESPALFGFVSACSILPLILLTPLGGLLADRVNKRNIMVALDFFTSAVILLFTASLGHMNLTALILVMLILLYGISGAYQPAVQASIPVLVKENQLLAANASINLVSSLAALLGPVLGGMLYSAWGLMSILFLSAGCFFFSAVMELFIHIPYTRQPAGKNVLDTIRGDLTESFSFIRVEKPVIAKVLYIVAGLNLLLSALLVVGTPVMVLQTMGLDNRLYGFTQGALAAGGLCGGAATGMFAKKLKIKNTHRLLLAAAAGLLPPAAALGLGMPPIGAYLVLTLCEFWIMAATTIFSVQMLAFVQRETPPHLTGKVISCVLAISLCAQPLGNLLYGGLFQILFRKPQWILAGAALASGVLAMLFRRIAQGLENSGR